MQIAGKFYYFWMRTIIHGARDVQNKNGPPDRRPRTAIRRVLPLARFHACPLGPMPSAAPIMSRRLRAMMPPAGVVMGTDVPARVVMRTDVPARMSMAIPIHMVSRVVVLKMVRTVPPIMVPAMGSVTPVAMEAIPGMAETRMMPPTVAGIMNHGGRRTDVNAVVMNQGAAEDRRS